MTAATRALSLSPNQPLPSDRRSVEPAAVFGDHGWTSGNVPQPSRLATEEQTRHSSAPQRASVRELQDGRRAIMVMAEGFCVRSYG